LVVNLLILLKKGKKTNISPT